MTDRIVSNAIGSQIRKHRATKNLTQQELAVRCNLVGFDISRETLSQIERQTRGVSDLEMILIARALKISVSDLVPPELPKWRRDLRPPNANE